MAQSQRLIFMYLGRRGAMARFALDVARALEGDANATLIISETNELAEDIRATGADVRLAPVFAHGAGALQLWRAPRLAAFVRDQITQTGADAVVELMAHVWSPFVEAAIRQAGARRVAILHDWRAHPGDASGVVAGWLAESALRADRTVTLSRFVADQVRAARPGAAGKLAVLFHPDFDYGVTLPARNAAPVRVLFMGRLAAYKGLDLFVEGLEHARAKGAQIAPHVCGAGDLGPLRARLAALGAQVENRWMGDAEIAAALSAADVVAVTYREASQSGVAAAAFGAGRPVIATPVGALPEQVAHERTGLIAARANGAAVGDVLARVASAPEMLAVMAQNVRAEAPQRFMQAFLRALHDICREGR